MGAGGCPACASGDVGEICSGLLFREHLSKTESTMKGENINTRVSGGMITLLWIPDDGAKG